jgi:hypothetical protein
MNLIVYQASLRLAQELDEFERHLPVTMLY